jgi:hypothetical protein
MAAFNHMLTLCKIINLDSQALLHANLSPTMHVHTVKVNNIQQYNICITYMTRFIKNNVKHTTNFDKNIITRTIN